MKTHIPHLILQVCVVVFMLGLAIPAAAHDPIPEELRNYLAQNPQATEADIMEFAQQLGTDTSTERLLAATYSEGGLLAFVKSGIEHILIGLDHVLFLVALALTTISLRHILQLSITFTLAHSVTFILAGSTALSLSAKIVEPIIALSIAAVAVLVFVGRKSKLHKWSTSIGIIFVFGLFHGLGFAGLLADLRIPEENFLASLISFNIGIELGQLLILLVAIPIIFGLRKTSFAREANVAIATALIVIGVFWALERTILM